MTNPTILDSKGNPIGSSRRKIEIHAKPSKQAFGLYGSIYSYNNAGKYRNRFYTLGDTSQGLDTLSRELLVRWSREMAAQLPFIKAAVKALSDFSIGNAYLPQYIGQDKEWWKQAEAWLLDNWYPNCNVRGSHYDFQTSLRLESQLLDIDGDYLVVYGMEDGFPKYQVIQNNRIKSQERDNTPIADGPMAGTIISDGIYYTPQGKVVGYNVENAQNLVNAMTTQTDNMVFSSRDAYLVLDPEFIDKLRGVPSIGAAILQAISIQELDSYLMEKIKIESTIALIQKTPSGEAPVEFQDQLQYLLNQSNNNIGTINGAVSPNTHALEIRQGADIKYIHSDGGDIKSLSSNSPANETADYMARLETQVLSTLGVPHQLIYSTDKLSGRTTSGVAEIFRASIQRRQNIIDRTAKFRVSWALAKAMEAGLIPSNDKENVSKVITFTKPPQFSLDARYDNDIIIENYQTGLSTLNDASSRLYNKSAEQLLDEQTKEQIDFYTRAKRVSDQTGVDINTVISGWRKNNLKTSVTLQADASN